MIVKELFEEVSCEIDSLDGCDIIATSWTEGGDENHSDP